MRIAVVGDFHLLENEWEFSAHAMDDIRAACPDLVVALGDFGTYGHIGSPPGIAEAASLLARTGAPVRPILGNHDLERESGPGLQPNGTVEEALRQRFGMEGEDLHGVVELAKLRLLFISTEPQPPDNCYQVQECYVSDRQFAELTAQLERRRGVPVIVFSHAPPLGCGLRTVPRTHVRSTNAYLDQNHEPERWRKLTRQFPEIVMWFSAHYHLSHHYEDAHTVREGVHFFLTGVHGSCTRDGCRQSRVIDIDEQAVSVATLDHERRVVLAEPDWRSAAALSRLMLARLFRQVAVCPVGDGAAQVSELLALPEDRFIAASEDDFTWEVWPTFEAVMGTLHVNARVRALAYSGQTIWSAWENWLGASAANRPDRFVRSASGGVPHDKMKLASEVLHLAAHPGGGVWFCDREHLWRAMHAPDETGPVRAVKQCPLPGPVSHLAADRACCWIVAAGEVWKWDGAGLTPQGFPGRAIGIEAEEGCLTVLLRRDGKLQLLQHRRADSELFALALPTGEEWGESGQERQSGSGRMPIRFISLDWPWRQYLFLYGHDLYYWKGDGPELLKLSAGAAQVYALARAAREPDRRSCACFAITSRSAEDPRCRLELWEYGPGYSS